MRTITIAATLALAGAAALLWPATASADVPVLERGDEGPAVRFYQDELNDWRAGNDSLGLIGEDGIFGPRTEAATRDLERAAGIEQNGVAERATWEALYRLLGQRSGRILDRTPTVTEEWPLPIPGWFWEWARWYLGRGEFDGQARNDRVRPAGAPTVIPEWAWRRINVIAGRSLESRADHFVEDRVQAIWSARLGRQLSVGEVTVTPQLRSALAPGWILLTATFQNPSGETDEQVAAWLRLVRGRWVPWEIGRLGTDRLNLEPRLVPCDLKPAFAEPSC